MPHKDPEERRRYLLANKARIAARSHAYYLANQEKRRAYGRAYDAAHKEQKHATDAKPEHKARRRAHAKAYWHDRPGQVAENNRKIKPKRADTEPTQISNRVLLAGRPKTDICEACGGLPDSRGIVFDHCHAKGHFRGWLCQPCNVILGLAKDNPEVLRKLIAYLERTRTNTAPQLVLSGI